MPVLACRYGDFLVPEGDDLILNALREYGEWAQEELELLANFIRAGDTVVDAGSFIGTHARAFSSMVGPQGRVFAFEPNPQIYDDLLQNVKLAPTTNITAFPAALGEQNASRRLAQDDGQANLGASRLCDASSDDAGSSMVKMERLDDLELGQIDFIKADVEGMEHLLLLGAKQSVEMHRPVIFLEANSLHASSRILDWAEDADYAVFGLVSSAFNAGNWRRSTANLFGQAKECGLLLIHRQRLPEWHQVLSALPLPPVETVDDLAQLLLHKPQYFGEVLAKTTVAARLGAGFASPSDRADLLDELQSLATRLALTEEAKSVAEGFAHERLARLDAVCSSRWVRVLSALGLLSLKGGASD